MKLFVSVNKSCFKTVVHEITNDGADPYHGKGYAWSNTHLKINLGESVKWTWKPPVSVQKVTDFNE
jgi:hypothetical protein